jgi:glycosyltransferase involved in cell wall biosynthesis
MRGSGHKFFRVAEASSGRQLVNTRTAVFSPGLIHPLMHSLRILQILPSLAPETGGPTRSVPALGKALAKLGHRVVLYTTTWPATGHHADAYTHRAENLDYEIITFPAQPSRIFDGVPCSPALVEAVLKNSRAFDIVHTFSLWNPVATFSLRALRHSGVPYCLSPLGMLDPIVLHRNRWKKLPWQVLWERANVEHAALVHFTAAIEEEKVRGSWRLNRTIVVPHVVDLEYWAALPARSALESHFPQIRGHEVILFVGRINWVKNIELLLSALPAVRRERPQAMLMCVGPDNEGYQAALENQAHALEIEKHVVFTGMLQGDLLKCAYARANALALVSQKENFGHAAAEALACGIPVVLSKGVGIGADWPANDAMIRVEPTPGHIAAALIRILQRSSGIGLPDPEALHLARNFLGGFPGARIAAGYEAVLSNGADPD